MPKPTDDFEVQLERLEPSHYSRIPHMAVDELGIDELTLYVHFKRTCGETKSGQCWKSNDTLIQETGLTLRRLRVARAALQKKGYIRVKRRKQGEHDYAPPLITVTDVWAKNHKRFTQDDPAGVVQKRTRGSADLHGGGSANLHTKEESIEEEPRKKKSIAPDGASQANPSDKSPSSKTPKPKTVQDELFELICLGSFGRLHGEIGRAAGHVGVIRAALLKQCPDLTAEQLKSGYQLYAKENVNGPTLSDKQRLKVPVKILAWVEMAIAPQNGNGHSPHKLEVLLGTEPDAIIIQYRENGISQRKLHGPAALTFLNEHFPNWRELPQGDQHDYR